MTDRTPLLAAIRTHPHEDLPRLLYADWLDEHGTSDLDAATAEFIRVSCDMKAGGRCGGMVMPMPRAAYHWIARNWRRLVPTAAAEDVGWDDGLCMGYPSGLARGRWVHAMWRLKVTSVFFPDAWLPRDYSVRLSFLRGFCARVLMWSPVARGLLTEPLRRDQPLVTFGPEPPPA